MVRPVTPQKWIKMYQLGKSSDYEKSEWKRRLKAKAQDLFPTSARKSLFLRVTCDALLISLYGLRQEFNGKD